MAVHEGSMRATRVGIALALTLVVLGAWSAVALGETGGASTTRWAGSIVLPSPDAVAPPVALPLRARTTPLRVSATSGSDGTWQLVAPPAGVPRFEPAIVFDPSRQRLVVFGGGDDDSLQSDTWVFSLATEQWSLLATAGTPPPARRLHGAVYDPTGDRMVIVGGWNEKLLEDAWQLSFAGTPTWTPIDATGPPGGRANFACAYDASNDRLVLYGGFDGHSEPLLRSGEVWTLTLGATPAWTQIDVAGPGPGARMGMTAGWDAAHHALYTFGGSDGWLHGDLWKLSLEGTPAWTLVSPDTTGPGVRAQAAGGFDPVSGRFAVFGGYSFNWLYADLWTIAPGGASPEWQDVTPDPTIRARWGAGSVVTPGGTLVVAGGVNKSGALEADVWMIDVGSPTSWSAVGDLYPYRMQEVMVMDPVRHRFIAFGGTDGAYRNDTYVHPIDTGRGWKLLNTAGPRPGPRRLHTGIYDPNGDRLIVFGGYDDHLFGDLWQLTLSGTPTWSPLVAAGTPPSPRAGHVAVYDPVGKQMIVALGWDGTSPPAYRTGTTYALSLTGTPTWSVLPSGPPRSSATAVYDDANQAMVVFGGTNQGYYGDAWQLSLSGSPAWTIVPATGPGAREEQSAAYDSKRDRMVVFGGYDWDMPYHLLGDLWSLDLPASGTPAWGMLAPDGTAPTPRWGMKALYDEELDGMWMYGGWDGGYSRQLYFLQWSDPVAPAVVNTTGAMASPQAAVIDWQLPAPVRSTVTVQRSPDGANWTTVGDQLVSGTAFTFTDAQVENGHSYAWRVQVRNGGTLMESVPEWLTIPIAGVNPTEVAFGLRRTATVAHGSMGVLCSIPQQAPGRVELIDVSGRRIDSRDLSAFGAGEHLVELGHGLEAGIYFARFTSGPRSTSIKGIVLR